MGCHRQLPTRHWTTCRIPNLIPGPRPAPILPIQTPTPSTRRLTSRHPAATHPLAGRSNPAADRRPCQLLPLMYDFHRTRPGVSYGTFIAGSLRAQSFALPAIGLARLGFGGAFEGPAGWHHPPTTQSTQTPYTNINPQNHFYIHLSHH